MPRVLAISEETPVKKSESVGTSVALSALEEPNSGRVSNKLNIHVDLSDTKVKAAPPISDV